MSGKDPTRRGLIKVALGCGDQVTVRNPPLNNKSTYICVAGKGHGYSQPWHSYTVAASGITSVNPLHGERGGAVDGGTNG